MLPREEAIVAVPEQTAHVAKMAFPKGNVYIWMRDELGQIYLDSDFADLYNNRGQPGWSAWRLALVIIMQFMEDLSDRQAAEAVRGRKNLRQLVMVERLRQHWVHHFYLDHGQVRLRCSSELPAAGDRFDSPYEPDSRYGKKRSENWRGYKVHISETCEPEDVHVITHVQTTPAHIQDIEQTAYIHQALAQKSLLPAQHFVDAGYVDAELLVSSVEDYGVELIGPVRSDPSWQAKQPEAYDCSLKGLFLKGFSLLDFGKIVTGD